MTIAKERHDASEAGLESLPGSGNAATHRLRQDWRERRQAMEARPKGRSWRGRVRRRLYKIAASANRAIGPTRLGRHAATRALDIDLTCLTLAFPDLPAAFDGYRILHFTDLHLDNIDGTALAMRRKIAGIEADLCVVTGDFRDNIHTPAAQVADHFGIVLEDLLVVDGVLGILGNHDSESMVEPLEALGVRMLINETVWLKRGEERIHITGLDDVHRFHTEAATEALATAPDGFGIALVHSPEVVPHAADRHRLYLCGHTHGGQVCLPGGRPVLMGLKRRHRRYARGLWRHGDMLGYTSRGIGASIVPLRYHAQAEMVLITLKCGPDGVAIISDSP